jgi:hypothetical protein
MHTSGVAEGIIASVIVTLGGLGLNRGLLLMRLQSKRARQRTLNEMEEPDFLQKRQRDVFRYIGLAVYFLGAYFAVSLGNAQWTMPCRFIFGLAVVFCGVMATRNAAVMNEYGVRRAKMVYEREEQKELKRKARRRELESMR